MKLIKSLTPKVVALPDSFECSGMTVLIRSGHEDDLDSFLNI